MGMVWVARLADDTQAAAIKANPGSAYDFVNPESDEDYEEAKDFLIDLDKQWHGIHFLVSRALGGGDSAPSLILGNFEKVGEDVAYGPVTFIDATKISEFHTAIQSIDDDQIADEFDPEAMKHENIYLADAFAREDDFAKQFLMEGVTQLRNFAKRAAEGGFHAFSVIT